MTKLVRWIHSNYYLHDDLAAIKTVRNTCSMSSTAAKMQYLLTLQILPSSVIAFICLYSMAEDDNEELSRQLNPLRPLPSYVCTRWQKTTVTSVGPIQIIAFIWLYSMAEDDEEQRYVSWVHSDNCLRLSVLDGRRRQTFNWLYSMAEDDKEQVLRQSDPFRPLPSTGCTRRRKTSKNSCYVSWIHSDHCLHKAVIDGRRR